jgi:CRP-like cAMP-binding protein
MARRKPTEPDTPNWTLSPQQETAVTLLASGKTITDTAIAVEVTRQTVSEWVNHHPGFQAAVNARRQELWDGMVDTLRGLLPKALDVLARELEGDTPLPTAVHV